MMSCPKCGMSLSQYYSKYKESVNASQFISVFKKGSIREVFPGQYLDVRDPGKN